MIEATYVNLSDAVTKLVTWFKPPPKLEVADIARAIAKGRDETGYSEKVMNLWPLRAIDNPQPAEGRVLVDEMVVFTPLTSTPRLPTYNEALFATIDADARLYIWRHKGEQLIRSLFSSMKVSTLAAYSRLPSRGMLVGGGLLAVTTLGAAYLLRAYIRHRIYGYAQRSLHGTSVLDGQRVENHVAVNDRVEAALNGDVTLISNIKINFHTKLIEWGIRERQKMAETLNYGKGLYEQQRRVRAVFELVEFGEDFILGCLSTLGDHRVLSRGELYIQLNRHLNGFIKAKQDSPIPLTIQQIGHLRAAMDMVCGDHVQVQVSR
jgi:hypothetical protein